METISLQAQLRERGTKGSVRALRNQGMLPAVLYGKEVGNVLLSVPTKSLEQIIANHSIGSTLINLDVADGEKGGSYLVMCREIQRDPVRRELLHADFYQVDLTEEIETEIPVVLVGEAPGVKQGGILQNMLRTVIVSSLPTQIPERLEADISKLEIGDQLTVGDLEPPAGVRIVSSRESVIALVIPPAIEEEEGEEAAEEAEGVEAGTAPEQGEE
ncbi:MAG: 50S ribosomal protein L25 [Thermacetogenium phaeum]|uniref:Large ribosomal subunit protein bL25 n=1 Tax=Thermacetogenium phaeum TaxID=85874 RepID=A0A117LBN3_9THEO|nr:MAG: 50S ribosomal protein L25 [Thermacetogenium phaeum]